MIENIRLQNFRSYRDDTFEFDSGVNIIVGPNASGKTNLLEALLVVTGGSSYRASSTEMIRKGKDWARLEAGLNPGKRIVKLDTRPTKPIKVFDLDGKQYKRLALDKTVPYVFFEPNHLRLLAGSPELRRDYLDDILEQISTGYGKLRRSYKRVLAQRNHLLKKGPGQGQDQLFAWDIRLSELGGQIAELRQNLVKKLNNRLEQIYQKLSKSKAKIEIKYDGTCEGDNYSSHMLKKLSANTDLDFLRGFTAYGPHRDDLNIIFDGHDASDTASRGEIRTLLLCLKIIELKLVEEIRGQKPMLLLDDVFSELDGARRQALTKYLKNYQTFITTTDADVVVQHFMNNCHIIPTTKANKRI